MFEGHVIYPEYAGLVIQKVLSQIGAGCEIRQQNCSQTELLPANEISGQPLDLESPWEAGRSP